ncbi:MAG: copper amine oxidase N-terminal domain-containing protein [Clostridiaceae bacterium]|nr:copper amine oxidase N-terminal domain-containing protein [Clostridiaceae bacterium]
MPSVVLAADTPKVIINGKALDLDVPPQIYSGRTFVPLRGIFEALGTQIQWDPTTETITATKGSLVIVLKVGESFAYINNEKVSVDAPARIVSGRTLVPLRFVSEALGLTVNWDDKTMTVTISSKTDSLSSPTSQKVMTPEEAVALFKARLEEIGLTVVDSGYGIYLTYDKSKDKVIDGVTYYFIQFGESYPDWGGIGFYVVNSITGEIYSIAVDWENYETFEYELDKNLADDEVFKQYFSPNEGMYEDM